MQKPHDIVSNSERPYRPLGVNEGLLQGLVRDMVQDRQGFIWLASEGLCRYDGRSFFRYRHFFGDSSSLASNNIQHLELDDKGNIWIGYIFSDSLQEIDAQSTTTGRIRHLSKEPAFHWLRELAARGGFFVCQTVSRYFVVSTNVVQNLSAVALAAVNAEVATRKLTLKQTHEKDLAFNSKVFSLNRSFYRKSFNGAGSMSV